MRHSPALTVRTRFGGMQQNAAYRPSERNVDAGCAVPRPGRTGCQQAGRLAKMSPRPGKTMTSATAHGGGGDQQAAFARAI